MTLFNAVAYFDMIVPFVRKYIVDYEEEKDLKAFKLEIVDAVLAQLDIKDLNKDNLTDELKKDILSRIRNMKSTANTSSDEKEDPSYKKDNLDELISMLSSMTRRTAVLPSTRVNDRSTSSIVDGLMSSFMNR